MTCLNKLFRGISPLHKYHLFCAPDPPPTPDYAGAAREQGVANIDAARIGAKMNNPNVFGPYGSQRVTWAGDQPTIVQTLAPGDQMLLDKSRATKGALSDLAYRGAGAAGSVIGKNLDLSGLPDAPGSAADIRTGVIDAMMSRVNEDTDRRQEQKRAEMLAAGIPPSSKAFQDAMAVDERTRTDARNQAFLAAGQEAQRDFGMGMESRRNALAELLAQRQTPLNEVTALMSGSQVANPFSMPGFSQNAQVAPAPIFGAHQAAADYNTDLYNVQAAQAGNLQQGLFGLGSAGIMGGMMRSDERLKTNIVRIGTHTLGIGWYAYDIDGRREQGVMAQELMRVKPSAVAHGADGWLMVNYDLIGRADHGM